MSTPTKPVGREAVVAALTDAAAKLVVDRGAQVSVREIAAEAGVNHGLVHTYFGTKQELLTAAFDRINERASTDLDEWGFPPADLAGRRGGELAKALARAQLDHLGNVFTSHPITASWRRALAERSPDLDEDSIDEMVAAAGTLALGWAVFGDQLCTALGVEPERRTILDAKITSLVASMGGLSEHVADDGAE